MFECMQLTDGSTADPFTVGYIFSLKTRIYYKISHNFMSVIKSDWHRKKDSYFILATRKVWIFFQFHSIFPGIKRKTYLFCLGSHTHLTCAELPAIIFTSAIWALNEQRHILMHGCAGATFKFGLNSLQMIFE